MGALSRAVREALIESGGVRPWSDPASPAPGEVAQRRFELRRLGDRGEREIGEKELGGGGWGSAEELNQGAGNAGWRLASDAVDSVDLAPDDSDYARQRWALDEAPQLSTPQPAAPRSHLPPLRVVGQVAQTYIIAEAPDGMYLIDQHAAHERVTYERLMARRGGAAFDQQNLLIPQTVELPPAAQALLLSNAELLEEWGFLVEDFGRNLRIRAVPAGLRDGALGGALAEVADHLHGRGGSTPSDWREAMLTTLACHSSIRAGQSLSHEEMRQLIIQLEQCQAPRTCPHGRPTMILLSSTQLERQFGRIK